MTLAGLGRLYRERGDAARAEQILREADERWRRRMGAAHPTGAVIRRHLGAVMADRGVSRPLESCAPARDRGLPIPVSSVASVTFGRRCIPGRGVARRLHTPGMRPPRALRAGRIAALGVNRTSETRH